MSLQSIVSMRQKSSSGGGAGTEGADRMRRDGSAGGLSGKACEVVVGRRPDSIHPMWVSSR